ncbi:hypothetical protein IHE45_19G063500 [Dioscorea alata]|uniref:Uncharacterized protein n=1 Tax=Dioscorea alata TaxID=55571 RepID=A0ACB7TYN2_DIOAL|nr:hypothetical protein IHE45_19G063500 [Dioscorea alata]
MDFYEGLCDGNCGGKVLSSTTLYLSHCPPLRPIHESKECLFVRVVQYLQEYFGELLHIILDASFVLEMPKSCSHFIFGIHWIKLALEFPLELDPSIDLTSPPHNVHTYVVAGSLGP